ncbi:tyrosine-type recombinase/integrase [Streptomyces mirabilis]|uniref:tyrosine-type recombinase/integrase n=1 Tax=Streptomyces mirabilis TaxID=68239 RepID=UPI0036A36C19
MRIGEALGLRHADIAAAERTVTVVPRNNVNRARSKSREQRSIPVSAELLRLWSDYLHAEYGDLDSDYVFVTSSPSHVVRPCLSGRLRPGAPAAAPHRHRLRPALVPAHRGHPGTA